MSSFKLIIVGIVVSGVMVGEVWFNSDKPLRDHDDITWQYFLFDNNLKKLTSGDWGNLFQARMFYPRQNTLAFGNSLLGQSLLALPVYLVTRDVVTAANSVIVINLVMAFGAMYLLAYRLTRSMGGSLIAGMIYTYNPYVMVHLHHEQLALQWLPLLFLVRKSWLWVGVGLMLLLSSFYYTLFAAVTIPMYMWLIRKPIKIWPVVVVAVVGWVYLQPFAQVKREYQVRWPVSLVKLLSAKPQDFLFTGPENWLYGRFNQSWWRDEFAREHPTEHSLFPGIVAVVLAGVAIVRRRGRVWWLLLGMSLVFAMGLMAEVYGALSVRAVSRWMVVGFLALGILAAYGWEEVSEKLKVKNEKLKHTIVLGGLLMVMIAEYRNVDWVKPFEISAEIKQFYSWLNQQAEVKVIVELPIANDLTNSSGWERSSYDDGQYLLYATLHNKALVNGHHSFIPGEVLRLGTRLTANFPTREKVDELRQMGVGVITVHEEEFADRRVGEKVINELRELGIEEAYNQGGLHGFRL